jgi:hypothetical protein
MADPKRLKEELGKLEGQLKRHGMWKLPTFPPPEIRVDDKMDPLTKESAAILNEVFLIRTMPMCCKMFGRVRDSAVHAFNYDYTTPGERIEYARSQLNRLIADIYMLPRIDKAAFSRVDG